MMDRSPDLTDKRALCSDVNPNLIFSAGRPIKFEGGMSTHDLIMLAW
jgi:hypothetical protein